MSSATLSMTSPSTLATRTILQLRMPAGSGRVRVRGGPRGRYIGAGPLLRGALVRKMEGRAR